MDTAISTLVASAEQGDRSAADALFAALHDELHRMPRRELVRRRRDEFASIEPRPARIVDRKFFCGFG